MRCFGFIFLFLLPISQIEATNFELLKCDKYTINDGLPQSFVQEFFQDNKGYLWISTQDGVSRFNGYKFENFYSICNTIIIINSYCWLVLMMHVDIVELECADDLNLKELASVCRLNNSSLDYQSHVLVCFRSRQQIIR